MHFKPSEHLPPSQGEKMSKRFLGGSIDCRDKSSSWDLVELFTGSKKHRLLT